MRQPKPPPDLIDLLARVLDGAPALPGAMCLGEAELFSSDEPDDVEAAIELCSWCCQLEDCRAWVAALPANTVSGVVGGELYTWVQPAVRRPQKTAV